MNTSATSILITWSPPPIFNVNGAITKYVVRVNNTITETSLNNIEVPELSIFTKYAVQVAAYTVEVGPFSSTIYVYTDESSKTLKNDNLCISKLPIR